MNQPRPEDLPTFRMGAQGPARTNERAAVARDILQQLDHPTALDTPLGETLIREGLLSREQLLSALEAQQLTTGAGVPMRLGQVLVAKGMLTADQVKHVLALLGKTVLHCPACGKNFNVKNWRPGVTVTCPACSVALVSPPTDRTLDAHATKVLPPQPREDEKSAGGKQFGRYRLLEKLGQGGMGVVWKAWDTQLKRIVALKQILAKGDQVREQIERFIREAQLAAKLRHPHIIAVYDVGEHEGQHYFTNEYVEGRSLEEAMKGRTAPKQLLSWVKNVAEALAYAHGQGVVHRDVKPANVLIDGHGKPFVMDFGLAKEVDLSTKEGARKATLTAVGAVMGTPMYMSPEQASGRTEALGPATDQFSLGVMLYQMLTQRLPFSGRSLGELFIAIMYREPPSPSRVSPRVHRDVETICLKALEKDPRRRYASMADLAGDLGRYLDGEPILARPVSGIERLLRRAKKNRAVVIPSAAAVLLAAGLLGWLGVSAHQRAGKLAELLADGRRFEESQDWDHAREAYQSARDLDGGSQAAFDGYGRAQNAMQALGARKDDEIRESAARQKAQSEALELVELGRKGVDAANRYLYDPNANYESLVKKVEVGQGKLDVAIQLAPDLAVAHYLLGKCWDLRGWDDKAEACWRKAIDLRPEFGPAHYELGRLLMMRSYFGALAPTEEEREANRPEARRLADEAGRELAAAGTGNGFDDPLQRAVAEVMQAHAAGEMESVSRLAERGIKEFGGQLGVEDFHWLSSFGAAIGSEERLAALTQALAIRPKHAAALYGRAHDRHDRGDIEGEIDDYTEALQLHRRFVAAWYNRGIRRQAGGDYAGAIQDFTEALSINPRFTAAWYNRGVAQVELGEIGEVVQECTMALGLNPRYAEAMALRGYALWKKGDVDGAIQECTEALEINPRLAEAMTYRGLAHSSRGDLDLAIQDQTDALKISPGRVDCLVNRAVARAGKGDVDGSIADCTEALKLDSGCARALTQRGCARRAKGELEGAIRDFTESLRVDPRFAAACYNRGVTRQAKGDLDGAIQDCMEALKIDPTCAEALDALGFVRQAQGDLGKAIQHFTDALKVNPRLAEAFVHRGSARSMKGDVDGAMADFNEALECKPRLPEALAARGLVNYLRGQVDAAVSDLTLALSNRPSVPMWWYWRGCALQKKGDLGGALKDYDESLKLDPAFPDAWSNRGSLRMFNGDMEGALSDLERALQLAPENWQFRQGTTAARDQARRALGRDGADPPDSGK